MTELFDYISGSDTGAIIAGSLLLKNTDTATLAEGQNNKYWANESVKWFEDNVEVLYRDARMPVALQVFIIIFFVILFTYLVFTLVRSHYRIKDFDINIEKLLDWINDCEVTFFDKSNNDNQKQRIEKLAK